MPPRQFWQVLNQIAVPKPDGSVLPVLPASGHPGEKELAFLHGNLYLMGRTYQDSPRFEEGWAMLIPIVMKKILFVEDNALIASIYSHKLAEAGFAVVVAADGLEAMKKLPEFKPDLVVLDLLMP